MKNDQQILATLFLIQSNYKVKKLPFQFCSKWVIIQKDFKQIFSNKMNDFYFERAMAVPLFKRAFQSFLLSPWGMMIMKNATKEQHLLKKLFARHQLKLQIWAPQTPTNPNIFKDETFNNLHHILKSIFKLYIYFI